MVRLILLLSFSFLTKQQSGGTLSSQPSAPSQPFEARNSISPPPQKLVSMPVESMVTDLLSVSLCCVYFCNLLSGWGLRGLQLCFLCDRCSRFAPSKSIFITNQQAAFCLLLLRGSGDIWLLPSAPASNPCGLQRLQICIHECFCQRPMYLLLRPQIVWSTCLVAAGFSVG